GPCFVHFVRGSTRTMMVSPARVSLLALVLALGAAPLVRAQSRDLASYALFADDTLRANGLQVVNGDLGVNAGLLASQRAIQAPFSLMVADMLRVGVDSTCSGLFANTVVGEAPTCGTPQAFTSPVVADLPTACGFPDPFPTCNAANPIDVT